MSELAREPRSSYPYKIAVLCDLRDDRGRLLLIRRAKDPNKGLYSPIGGKLDTASGESPAMCAQREIHEEAGIDVPIDRLHLGGIISEHGYQGQTNWLMFWYRVLGPVTVTPHTIGEGDLEWHAPEAFDRLPLPDSDRRIIWPLVHRHDAAAPARPGFFAVHVECEGQDMTWRVEQSTPPSPR
ncbi:MAG: NUDIX domain-containing protein [Phycisphaerae bacterium]|nr:NUDIX domain-containing protein [Phycisphaerae bacterium]